MSCLKNSSTFIAIILVLMSSFQGEFSWRRAHGVVREVAGSCMPSNIDTRTHLIGFLCVSLTCCSSSWPFNTSLPPKDYRTWHNISSLVLKKQCGPWSKLLTSSGTLRRILVRTANIETMPCVSCGPTGAPNNEVLLRYSTLQMCRASE